MSGPRRGAPGARVMMVVNDPAFVLTHWIGIAEAARAAGHEVTIAAPPEPAPAVTALSARGLAVEPVAMSRGALDPAGDLRALRGLARIMRRVRPDLVHLIGLKPVILGAAAARRAGIGRVLAMIPGLGYSFASTAPRARLARRAIRAMLARALRGGQPRLVFENAADRATFRALGVAAAETGEIVPGAGVDLARFDPGAEPERPPLVAMTARLLFSKGVGEFEAAAARLRRRGVEARFACIGVPDAGSPDAVDPATLARWRRAGNVEFWGWRDDVPEILGRAALAVLPSYYGEGRPKVLLEAAAAARPVVTTDMPGCRAAVEPGRSALIVPPRDPEALAGAIATVLGDPGLAARLGRAGRALAERDYPLESVVARYMALYDELLGGDAPAAPSAMRPPGRAPGAGLT